MRRKLISINQRLRVRKSLKMKLTQLDKQNSKLRTIWSHKVILEQSSKEKVKKLIVVSVEKRKDLDNS